MLLVGTPGYRTLAKQLDGSTIDGITFHVVKTEGLTLTVTHDSTDAAAKACVKNVIKRIPSIRNLYSNIQIIDENGRIN